ncbi:MAG: hypothetical protein AAGI45_05570 [Cyanobacteria bacterium P01_H01_bin.26]
MAWWLKSILIGVIGLGLALPGAMALAAGEPSARAAHGYSDKSAPPLPVFPIAPELTNPAETPVAEALPKPITWLTEAVATEPVRADSIIEQWLAWLKTLWADR